MRVGALIGAWWGAHAAHLANVPRVGTSVFYNSEPRTVFCLNWSGRVPDFALEAHDFVNFHCTPLPFGRGGAPIENMIRTGHTHTVITAHRMSSELDAGPIYGCRGPISLAGTKEDICARFIEPVAEMMRWILDTNPEPTPQMGEPVYFKRLSPEAYREFWAARANG